MEIKEIFGAHSDSDDVLVIRDEYEQLFEAFEAMEDRGIIVTGQPGIGSYEYWFQSQVEC